MSKKFFQIIALSALIVSVGGIGAVQAELNAQQKCEQVAKGKWSCLGSNATGGDCCKASTSPLAPAPAPAFAPGLPPMPKR